jgi:hypothetical protein
MPVHLFTLHVTLPDQAVDVDALIESLYEAGFDDAMIDSGQPGRLALDFSREAESADQAMDTAIRDVQRVLPGAVLELSESDYVLQNPSLAAQIRESQKTHAEGSGYKPTKEQLEDIYGD